MKKMLGILLLVLCMSAGNVYAAALEISCGDCANAVVGSEIKCTVSVNSAPNAVESFGFVFSYNSDILNYKECPADDSECERGLILQNNPNFVFDVNKISSNQLRCGGYGVNPIPAGTGGELVILTFEVIAKGLCGAELSDLTDNFGCWSSDPPIVPEIPEGQAFSIPENSQNGKYAGMVTVNNYTVNSVDFSIAGGNTDNVFSINNLGIISVQNSEPLNYINKPEYLLNIRASACDNTLQDESVVRINIAPLKGNINADDSIDIQDAILTLKILSGIQADDISPDADVNSDSRIGIEEAIYILRDIADIQ